MREKSMAQGVEHQRLIMRTGKGESNHLTTKEIEDGTEIPEFPMEPEVGEIRSPENIPVQWAESFGNVSDGQWILAKVTWFTESARSPAIWLDPKLFHHTKNAFPVPLQVESQPAMSIAWVIAQGGKDLLSELLVPLLHGGLVVQGRTGDAHLLSRLPLVCSWGYHLFFWERERVTVISPTSVFNMAFSFLSAFISRRVGAFAATVSESQL